MSEWTDGYRAALSDLASLSPNRGVPLTPALCELLADLAGDALVIEREQGNRIRRRRLTAAREATLFDELPP